MIVRVREWYSARTGREQKLILLMTAIALPVLGWLFVLPFANAYDDAFKRHLEAVDRHGRILSLADAVTDAPAGRSADSGADLQVVVSDAASQAGITLQSANAMGPDAFEIAITGTSAPIVTQWFRDLESRGIFVQELRMNPQPDGSLSVSARLARSA